MPRLSQEELTEVRQAADSSADPLIRLAAIRKGTEHWTALLHEAVTEARTRHIPWERIAAALGVSRQAVTKRFRVRVVEESEEAT